MSASNIAKSPFQHFNSPKGRYGASPSADAEVGHWGPQVTDSGKAPIFTSRKERKTKIRVVEQSLPLPGRGWDFGESVETSLTETKEALS